MANDAKNSDKIGCGIIIAILVAIAILVIAPMAQFWVVFRFVGEKGIAAFFPVASPVFYQFVLTSFAVLAVVAGYLTYKSREEAREEIKRIKEEFDSKKKEIDKYCDGLKVTLQVTL